MSADGPGQVTSDTNFIPNPNQKTEESVKAEGATSTRKVTRPSDLEETTNLEKAKKKKQKPILKFGGPGNSKPIAKMAVAATTTESQVSEPVKKVWQHLAANRPQPNRISEVDEGRAFTFAGGVVQDTAVRLSDGENKLTPYNWVTLGGQKIGIAARGPVGNDANQKAVFFKAAYENNCCAIINLATALEGVTDYIPEQGKVEDSGSISVEATKDQVRGSSARHSHITVKTEGNEKHIEYIWEGNIPNRGTGNPKALKELVEKVPQGTLLVHCKMGIGRTAMFMLALAVKNDPELTRENMVQTVFDMIQDGRQCRGEFLENEGQLNTVLQVAAMKLGMSDSDLDQAVVKYIANKQTE